MIDQIKNLSIIYFDEIVEIRRHLHQHPEELFSLYHNRVPFVKNLMKSVSNRAQQRGQIRTLLGRLCRFHLWEPNQFGMHKALPFEQAGQEGTSRTTSTPSDNNLVATSGPESSIRPDTSLIAPM